jgi:hypothetical protein
MTIPPGLRSEDALTAAQDLSLVEEGSEDELRIEEC